MPKSYPSLALYRQRPHNSTTELTGKNYGFLMKDLEFKYYDNKQNKDVKHELTVIVSKASRLPIESTTDGRVLLGSNWMDFRTWLSL